MQEIELIGNEMRLEFYPTDNSFVYNLQQIHENRLQKHQFFPAFVIKLETGFQESKNAYVKGDNKTFEYDGIRISLSKVIRVDYYPEGLP